jgi:hypothetical protein
LLASELRKIVTQQNTPKSMEVYSVNLKCMIKTVRLKNASEDVILDTYVHDFVQSHDYYQKIELPQNLRRHSSGYAFFQKNRKQLNGGFKCETIYLHKAIAEQFIPKPKSSKRLFVRFNNGNPLDCRIQNLTWTPLANIVRNTTKTYNKYGYRGVVQDRNRFRAVIYENRKPINIGSFDTLEEAAEAYNKKSQELFGTTRSLNIIKK